MKANQTKEKEMGKSIEDDKRSTTYRTYARKIQLHASLSSSISLQIREFPTNEEASRMYYYQRRVHNDPIVLDRLTVSTSLIFFRNIGVSSSTSFISRTSSVSPKSKLKLIDID